MDVLGLGHTLVGFAAIAAGGLTLARQKGTRTHRGLGYLYLVSMVSLNGTALLIYDLFGRFGPFHWLALGSLATVLAGLLPVLRKRRTRGWLFQHAQLMSWSYVGLLAAAVSEVTTRWLAFPFGWTVVLSSLAVFFVGGLFIRQRVPQSVRALSLDTAGQEPD